MSRLKSMANVLDHLLYAIPKNISIFVSLSINATGTKVFPYYRFLCSGVESLREQPLLKNKFRSTVDLYHQIVDDFFEGSLCSVYDTVIKLDQDYLGICLENVNKEKLNLYYSKDALYLYDEMKKKVEEKKYNDFCDFGKEHLENYRVKRMVFYPAVDDRSSVIYIFDNEEYNSLRKQRQFGFYYRKSGNCIDFYDLEAMLALIRYFINIQIEADPIYIYETNYSQLSSEKMTCVPFKFQTKSLKIMCNTGAFIEITDDDLITLIEHARIIDDLWLVMNGVIQEMPLQEESRSNKEMLRQRRLEFLKDNPSIRKGKA